MKKLHAERLLQVVRVLEELPKTKRFNLRCWHKVKPFCGTEACAVGWAAADPWFKRRGLKLAVDDEDNGGRTTYEPVYRSTSGFDAAADFFSITFDEALHLFSPLQYFHGKRSRRDVIRRIKAFVKANTWTKPFTVEQLRCLELARIIREGLEGVRFDMGVIRNYCGTAGCIAGYVVAVYDPLLFKSGLGDHRSHKKIELRAQELLGVSDEQHDNLFYAVESPYDKLRDITPAMAAATLENYALTGKVEWPKP